MSTTKKTAKKKTAKKTSTRGPRQRVHCTKCVWSGQRSADEDPGNCILCGAPCEGPGEVGRPAIAESERRVRVVAFVLPATLKWLGDSPGPKAASILDEDAQRTRRR